MNRSHYILLALALGATLTGCARNPEPVIRQRAQKYTQLLIDDQFDQAVDYFDPDIVAKEGRTAVMDQFKVVIGIVKGLTALGGRKPDGFVIRTVDIDTAKTHANVQVIFLTTDNNGGDRKEHPTDQKWALKNNTWYAMR